jgi:hypothetical protein
MAFAFFGEPAGCTVGQAGDADRAPGSGGRLV